MTHLTSVEQNAHVRRTLDALRALEWGDALESLALLADGAPEHEPFAEARNLVRRLAGAGPALEGVVSAFREATRDVPPPIPGADLELPQLCRRVVAFALGERAERECGPAGSIAGWDIAKLYLEAGQPQEARSCAQAVLAKEPASAAAMASLAETLVMEGTEAARIEGRDLYHRALVIDSAAVDVRHSVDPEIRDLVSLAENDYEISRDPEDWVLVVGYLEGVFPIDYIHEEEFRRDGADTLLSVPATTEDPIAFYHYLRVSESHQSFGDEEDRLRIEARKRLKEIHPALYARYLKRF